ncbi:MAG: hypothetical protein ACRC33_12265, partial [Gemmataceae bacterium]
GQEPDRKRAVEGLLKVMNGDKHEYVQRSVTGALMRLGKHAEPALPVLREGTRDKDVNVANSCKAAVEAIEKAEADSGAEARARLVAAIRDDLRAYLAARRAP